MSQLAAPCAPVGDAGGAPQTEATRSAGGGPLGGSG